MQEDRRPLEGRTVLVVKANLDVLEATAYLIEAAFGCNVLGVTSCIEALALLDEGHPIELVFADAMLPGKCGLTLARLARERRPDLPVVLTTEWDDEIDAIVERGYVALVEPYGVKQLEAVFTELLSVRHATSRSSANSSGEDAMSMLVQWDQATQRQKSQHPNHT